MNHETQQTLITTREFNRLLRDHLLDARRPKCAPRPQV